MFYIFNNKIDDFKKKKGLFVEFFKKETMTDKMDVTSSR